MASRTNNSRASQEKKRLKAERAAAAVRERRRRERRRQLLTGLAVLVAIALVVVVGFVIHARRHHDARAAILRPAIPGPGSSYGLTIGSATASHDVVVYEDFLSPESATFEKATQAELAQLAAAGRVRVEYRPIITSTKSEYSARATLIWYLAEHQFGAEVGTRLHDLLFEHQPPTQGPYPSRDDVYALAQQAGATVADLRSSVDASDDVDEVAEGTTSAKKLGVTSTPLVALDGRRFEEGESPADLAKDLLHAVQ